MAVLTIRRTVGMSGSAVTIMGGTSETVEIFWPRASRAREMKRSTSLGGMLVEIIAEDALAIASKFLSAVCGLIWRSMAPITHFWRAIRE